MLVIFGRNNTFISHLIRWRTNSQWSHCAIIDNCGTRVIEAMGKKGVKYTSFAEFNDRYTHTSIRIIDGDIEKARQQLGSPFDFNGMINNFLRLNRHDSHSWFCSELVAYASDVFADHVANKVTPEHLYWVGQPVEHKAKVLPESSGIRA